jgi:hypothetical protein
MTNQVEVIKAQIDQSRLKVDALEKEVRAFEQVVDSKRFVVGPSYGATLVSFDYSMQSSESDSYNHHLAYARGERVGKVYVTLSPVNHGHVALTEDLSNSIETVKRDILRLARSKNMIDRRELYLAEQAQELLRTKIRTAYHSEEMKENHDDDADLFCSPAGSNQDKLQSF